MPSLEELKKKLDTLIERHYQIALERVAAQGREDEAWCKVKKAQRKYFAKLYEEDE